MLAMLRVPHAGDLAFFDHGATVGKHVYVGATAGDDGCPAGVRIVDVRDPRKPRVVATAGGLEEVLYEDVEVRRITLRHHGSGARAIDVTSYAEMVLGAFTDDLAHPAFGKLFVETEYSASMPSVLQPYEPIRSRYLSR